jgi:hypothetical protein
MKTYTGGTVVAGRWYDLTYFGGTPPAFLHGNLASNYDFLAGASNWTFSAGFSWTAATHLMTKSNSGNVETLQQNVECLSTLVYEVTWTLGSYAGSGNVSISIGGGTAVTRAANGTFVETITAGASNNTLLFSFATTITAATVDVIIVRKLKSFTPYSSDTTIYPYNSAGEDLAVYTGGNVSTAVKALINGGAWTNVAAGAPSVLMIVDMLGCYPKIRTDLNTAQVLDNQEHITNGTFTGGSTGWTVNSGWAYSSNTMLKNASGTGTLQQSTIWNPVIGKTYTIHYDITSFTTTGTLQCALGGVTGAARTITGTGTFFESFTATSTSATFSITPSDAIRITLDNVSVGIGCPRYGDGKGVMAYEVIDTTNGANAQNFSMVYNGTQGLGARNLGAVVANTASAIQSHISCSGVAAGNFGPFLPLAPGEAGVADIDSALFSAASAGAGFVNIVLCKPLATIPLTAAFYASERDLLNQLPSLPQVKDGACLGFIIFAGAVIPNPCMYQGYLTSVWK